MATDIERVKEKVIAARREVERISEQCTELPDTQQLREVMEAARLALVLGEFLLTDSVSAEKFWQLRQAHRV